jgi:DNA-binding CsgD family transcriptional regulator
MAREVRLSPRELEIVRLIARGDSWAEVALKLGSSYSAVSTHGRRIFKKLNARNQASMVYIAMCRGLLSINTQDCTDAQQGASTLP